MTVTPSRSTTFSNSERTSFSAPRPAVSASVAAVTAAPVAPPGTAAFLAAAASARDPVAWVANYASNTVSPVNVATRKAGRRSRRARARAPWP